MSRYETAGSIVGDFQFMVMEIFPIMISLYRKDDHEAHFMIKYIISEEKFVTCLM